MASGKPTAFAIENRGDRINSVEDFLSVVFAVRRRHKDRKFLYRGHSDKTYKLRPTIGRPHQYADKKNVFLDKQEINLLHRFRRRAYPILGRAVTAGEAIFIARHHWLPTRLLDWTANGLYGLYFACCEHWESDGRLWAMLRVEDQKHDESMFDLAMIDDEKKLFKRFPDPTIKIIHPFYNSDRLRAQDGAFTIQSDPRKPLEDFANEKFAAKQLDTKRYIAGRFRARVKPRLSGS
jgi:hypothetical protein